MNNRISGTNRVTESLSLELLKTDWHNLDVLLVKFRPWHSGLYKINYDIDNDALRLKSIETSPLKLSANDVFLGLDLSHASTIAQSSFFKYLQSAGGIVAFVLYDLLPIQYPNFFDMGLGLSRLHVRWLTELSRANIVFPISKTVRKKWYEFTSLIDTSSNSKIKCPTIRLGSALQSVGVSVHPPDQLKFLSSEKFVLAVGTIEPRKRIDQILFAMRELWVENFDTWLVLVGKPGWLTDTLQEEIALSIEMGQKVIWLDECDDSALAWLYSETSLLVAASVDEGFGLPIIEGLHYGAPVLARDIEVFHEVGGIHCDYFNGDLPSDLRYAIKNSLSKNTPRSPSSDLTSWNETARSIISMIMSYA